MKEGTFYSHMSARISGQHESKVPSFYNTF